MFYYFVFFVQQFIVFGYYWQWCVVVFFIVFFVVKQCLLVCFGQKMCFGDKFVVGDFKINLVFVEYCVRVELYQILVGDQGVYFCFVIGEFYLVVVDGWDNCMVCVDFFIILVVVVDFWIYYWLWQQVCCMDGNCI